MGMRVECLGGFLVLGLAAGCGLVRYDPVTGDGGQGDGVWQFQRRLTFDNAAQSEDLLGFPVLVALTPDRIDYGSTQGQGQDVRFADPNGDDLAYEIEQWDPSGQSFVWVKVPQIDGGSTTDFITMRYGNPTAPDHQDPLAVWDNGYVGVWHRTQDPTEGSALDSLQKNAGTPVGMTASNQIAGRAGGSLSFDGVDDRVTIAGTDPSFDFGTGDFSISVWLRRDAVGPNFMTLFGRYENGAHIALESTSGMSTAHAFWLQCPGNSAEIPVGGLVDGQWHSIAGTKEGTTVRLYADGVMITSSPGWTCSFVSDDVFSFGYNTSVGSYLTGGLDEGRLSNVARSGDWLAAQQLSMTDSFVTFGPEETVDL